MLLLQANIPEFLLSSPYLQSLLSNGPFPEEGLEIPDGSGKQDLTVNCKADLIELLSTLRFWLVPEVAEHSSDLLPFAFLPTSQTDFVEVATEFRDDIPFVDELLRIVNSIDVKKLEIASQYGHVHVLQFLCEKDELKPTSQAACVAAGEGHLDCLTYLHSRGAKLSDITIKAAARGGHFECVMFLISSTLIHEQQLSEDVHSDSTERFYSIDRACYAAAEHGHMTCVKQMLAKWGALYAISVLAGAVKGNQLEILRHATSIGHDEESVYWAMKDCARNGYLECLEHLHNLGYDISADLMNIASAGGHLNCLKFLHEHNYPNNENVCFRAAESGHLDCLQYAHEQGMPWHGMVCAGAAAGGHLACLQYAREQGCIWVGTLLITNACRARTTECLQYVLEQGVEIDAGCATSAVYSRSLVMLQFLHARGVTWEASACAAAVQCCCLKCLRFLHEIGTPWDARSTLCAVQKYNYRHIVQNSFSGKCSAALEMVEYLHTHGCPWHTDTCLTAAQFGSVDCLQYAHEHGAPWTSEVCRQAATIECYEYAVEHGCPGAELNTLFFSQKKRKYENALDSLSA